VSAVEERYKQTRVPDAVLDRYFRRLAAHDGTTLPAESLFYYFRIEDHVPENHNRAFRFGADALAMGFFRCFLPARPVRLGEDNLTFSVRWPAR